MGFGVSLIIFSPNTIAKSADVNANFSALNGATTFTGTVNGWVDGSATTLQQQGCPAGITLDGSGNLTFPNDIPKGSLGAYMADAVVFTGTGSGNYSHGLNNGPDAAYAISDSSSAGTTIYSCYNLASSSISVAASAVEHFSCICIWAHQP